MSMSESCLVSATENNISLTAENEFYQNSNVDTSNIINLDNADVTLSNNNTPDILLKNLKLDNKQIIIIGHLNINSIRNKFEQLQELVNGSIDILVISETKIDETFPFSQFYISGYSKPYRLDRTAYGGGVMIYVKENIPSKILKLHSFADDIESIIFEINLHKRKWLLCGGYNPHRQSVDYFWNILVKH